MRLRRKLLYLLISFSLFVVSATVATIASIRIYVAQAIDDFHRWTSRFGELEHMPESLDRLVKQLEETLDPDRPASASSLLELKNPHAWLLDKIERISQDDVDHPARLDHSREAIFQSARDLHREITHFLDLVEAGDRPQAEELLRERIDGQLAPTLRVQLRAVQSSLEDLRVQSVESLARSSDRVMIMAVAIMMFAAALVFVGSHLINRWLIVPIAELQRATDEFRQGHLTHRARPLYRDELGDLAAASNTMAESLSQAHADLTLSERKFRSLFESLRDAAVVCDDSGRIVECHDSDTQLLTLHRRDLAVKGTHVLEAWPEWREGAIHWSALIDDIIHRDRRLRRSDVELIRTRDDAEPVIVDLVAYPIEYGQHRHAAIVMRDARERRQLERRLHQAETMEMAGTLAGGIAHDFNNLLTGAIGLLSLAEKNDDPLKRLERIRTALRACWKAAGLSRRLLRFARGGQAHPRNLHLSDMVRQVVESLDESYFAGLEVVTDFACDVVVRVDKDELTQIVLNLLSNAKDAMPQGGRLSIQVSETSAVPETAAKAPHPQEPCARHGVLSVTDTGVGMAPSVMKRIFEPFFTTKTRTSRRGTGMGLAAVYGAVRAADGLIDVQSEKNVGTRMRVYLPATDDAPDDDEPSYVETSPTRATPQTILVVDDDPVVLHACTDALEAWGYHVVTAEDVESAKQRFAAQRADDPIQLALLDIVLPDGSGVDLAAAFCRTRPDLKVVLMSGFAQHDLPPSIEPYVLAYLDKPFTLDQLAAGLAAANPKESV